MRQMRYKIKDRILILGFISLFIVSDTVLGQLGPSQPVIVCDASATNCNAGSNTIGTVNQGTAGTSPWPGTGVIIQSDLTTTNLAFFASYTTPSFDLTKSKFLDLFITSDQNMELTLLSSADNVTFTSEIINSGTTNYYRLSVAPTSKFAEVKIRNLGSGTSTNLTFQTIQRSVTTGTILDQGAAGLFAWTIKGQQSEGGAGGLGNSIMIVGKEATTSVSRTPVVMNSNPAGTEYGFATRPIPYQFSYNNITTNATTTVKSGAGILHLITVNTKGTATTATLYDNTAGSGTKIGTLNTTFADATFTYDVGFSTGLTVVTAGTTAADLTVSYK